jgi:hypothetical protein
VMWPAFFYPHIVSVRAYRAGGGMGGGFAPSRELAAEVKDERRLIRDRDGSEVVSSSQVTVPLGSNVPLGSLVTVWAGTPAEREATVLQAGRDDNTDTLLDSFEVLYLT